jgi:hypothetical protein
MTTMSSTAQNGSCSSENQTTAHKSSPAINPSVDFPASCYAVGAKSAKFEFSKDAPINDVYQLLSEKILKAS